MDRQRLRFSRRPYCRRARCYRSLGPYHFVSGCNCVRATACESFSLNYRTIVPREAVFDRIPLSHEITLFDIDRFLGDVVSTDEVVGFLDDLPRAND